MKPITRITHNLGNRITSLVTAGTAFRSCDRQQTSPGVQGFADGYQGDRRRASVAFEIWIRT